MNTSGASSASAYEPTAQMPSRQAPVGLFPLIAVGCFTCPHTVRETSPEAAHDAMERHYSSKHAAQIAALVGDLTPLRSHP